MPVMVLSLGVVGCSTSDSTDATFAADDARLGALAVNPGTLTPAFASEVVGYAVTVANGTGTFQVTPSTHSPKAYAVQVKQGSGAFTVVPSGTTSPSYPVPAVGASSPVTIRVIAEDQVATKVYVVTVTQARGLSGDATLRSLAVSQGSLAPAFASSTVAYTDAVPYGTASWTVTPTVNESHATVQVKQGAGTFAPVASGSASAALAVPAVGGSSTVTVRVTAENGTTKDYAIAVSQIAPSADAALQGLAVSGASLVPGFASSTSGYGATLPNGTATFTVTPTVAESHATVQVKQDSGPFATVPSGSASAPLTAPAAGGATTLVTVRVTAQDGTTTQDYTITVDQTAALSTDASLQALSLSAGSLVPAFTTGTLGYTAVLPNPTTTFTVTPTTTDPHATVEVAQDGGTFAAVASGSASAALTAPAADGVTATTLTVRVTAQDGVTQQDYTIAVTQAAPATDATLSGLASSAGSLSPAFASSTSAYTVALPNGTATFTVTPTASEPHATIQVAQDAGTFAAVASGSASAALTAPAADGTTTTTLTVRVTAQDGVTTKDYTITATQLAPAQEVLAFFPLYASTIIVPTGDVSGEETFSTGPLPWVIADPTTATSMADAGYKDGATAWSPATFWHDTTGATTTPTSTLLQRSTIAAPGWPVDPDMLINRWVQFAVSTSPTKTFTVDTVSFFGGSGGGTGLRFRVWYATSPDFVGAVELTGLSMMTAPVKNDMYLKAATGQAIVVNPGGTLYVRIYPWMASGSAPVTGKYLLLQSFTVHGFVQ
jgi:hypothetical protein